MQKNVRFAFKCVLPSLPRPFSFEEDRECRDQYVEESSVSPIWVE